MQGFKIGSLCMVFFETARLWLLLVAAGVAWGSMFSLAKLATEGAAHPLALNFWQTLCGFAALLCYTFFRQRKLQLSKRHIRFYVVAGILGSVLPGVLYLIATERLPAGIVAITIATVPMLTLAISIPLGSERLSLAGLLGLGLGISGILLIVLPDASLPDAKAAPFVILAVICAFCYAIENVYIDLRMPPGEALTILCGMLAMASVIMAPIAFISGVFWWPTWPMGSVEWSLLGLALINAFAYGTFVHLVNTAGPVFASQAAYITTLSGIAWGMILFGESHSAWIIAAASCMMVGLTLVRPRRAPHEPDT